MLRLIGILDRGRARVSIGVATALAAGIFAFPPPAAPASSTVVISQVYVSGGLPGAAWRNDYVVLFNNGTTGASLSGWTLQYNNGSGGIWSMASLCGTIAHGHYYLVRLASGGAGGATLPTADCTGAFDLSTAHGTVALVGNSTPITGLCPPGGSTVDLVGYLGGTPPSCFEGSGPAPATSPTTADHRSASCIDTDNNAADFATIPASPQNSSATNGCNNQPPSVASIGGQMVQEGEPLAGTISATDANGDPITYGGAGPSWFTVNSVSGAWSAAPGFDAAEISGGSYNVTVTASDTWSSGSTNFTITVIDRPTASNLPFSGVVGGGVNPETGELCMSLYPDLCIGGPMPMKFSRSYGSLMAVDGALSSVGRNWRHNFDWTLSASATTATVTDATGLTIRFAWTGSAWSLQSPKFAAFQLVSSGLVASRAGRAHSRGTDAPVAASSYVFGDPRSHRAYTFDASGKLTLIEDGHGNAQTLSYAGTLLSSVTDGLGRTLSFSYDGSGNLNAVSDGSRSVSLDHSGGNLTGFTDAAGHTMTYGYVGAPLAGLLTSATQAAGNTPWTQVYGSDGRVVQQIDALGHTWSYSYGPGLTTTLTDPLGNHCTWTYDASLRLTSLTDPVGGITSYTYDANGRLVTSTRPLGQVTSLAYDPASGYRNAVTFPDGSHASATYGARPLGGITFYDLATNVASDGTTWAYTYDAQGNMVKVVDPAGFQTTATYGSHGEQLSRSNPAGGIFTFVYDTGLRPLSWTDPAGNTLQYVYDAMDRLLRVINPDSTRRSYTYDPLENPVAATDELGKTWSYTYDVNGRLVQASNPLAQTTQFAYDALNRVVQCTNGLGGASSSAYDAAGRRSSSTDASGRTTSYSYDALGRLTGIIDPGGNAYAYAYDANGRLTSAADPLAHAMSYLYDDLGRVTRRTDPMGFARHYGYDVMGRAISSIDPVGTTTSRGYDARGYLTSFVDASIEVDPHWNNLGRLDRIHDPTGQDWLRGFDAQGRITSATDPLGRSSSYTYDSRNRLAQHATPLGTVDYGYDARGRFVSGSYSDGTSLSYSYDDAGRLVAAPGASYAYDAAGRMVSSNGIGVGRDAAGRITSITYAPGKVVSYTYDARGLLASVQDWIGGTTSFTRDAHGHRVAVSRPNGVTTSYEYDANDGLTRIREVRAPSMTISSVALTRDPRGLVTDAERNVPLPAGSPPESSSFTFDAASQVQGFGYDGLGRLVQDDRRAYRWDLASRLSSWAAVNDSAHYTWDALNQPLTRTRAGVTEHYVWNDALPLPALSKVTVNGGDIEYVYTPGGLLLYAVDAGGQRHYHHFDEMGNTLFITADDGTVETKYAYAPYGRLVAAVNDVYNPFTFGGQFGVMREGQTGLYLMRRRLYDSRTSRFLSRDPGPSPLHPKSVNPYQYALENPLAYVDPRGASSQTPKTIMEELEEQRKERERERYKRELRDWEKYIEWRRQQMDMPPVDEMLESWTDSNGEDHIGPPFDPDPPKKEDEETWPNLEGAFTNEDGHLCIPLGPREPEPGDPDFIGPVIPPQPPGGGNVISPEPSVGGGAPETQENPRQQPDDDPWDFDWRRGIPGTSSGLGAYSGSELKVIDPDAPQPDPETGVDCGGPCQLPESLIPTPDPNPMSPQILVPSGSICIPNIGMQFVLFPLRKKCDCDP